MYQKIFVRANFLNLTFTKTIVYLYLLRFRYINTQLTVFDWKIAGAVVIKFAVDLMSLPINHGFLLIIDTQVIYTALHCFMNVDFDLGSWQYTTKSFGGFLKKQHYNFSTLFHMSLLHDFGIPCLICINVMQIVIFCTFYTKLSYI